uniref:Uncharacterized protein n=1 Tax=Thermosporothrix sp. COM3 TaxID=2490863 RepID=A0A455SI88_9CHLR|nr:hypothetical protein KTC_29180 [Thermosporothrix sp. COM3]
MFVESRYQGRQGMKQQTTQRFPLLFSLLWRHSFSYVGLVDALQTAFLRMPQQAREDRFQSLTAVYFVPLSPQGRV